MSCRAVTRLCLALFIAVGASAESRAADNADASKPVDFARQVGPVLAKRCAGCHNPGEHQAGLDLTQLENLLRGGESGPALVPGKPDESLIWQRISSDEMPPKTPLTPAERELVRAWIKSGANWAGGALDPLEYTTEARAGYDWWSLQPLKNVKPPKLPSEGNSTAPANPIDTFLSAKRGAAGLAESPAADRRTLVRRLSFALLGLPPEPAEVEAFLNDNSPTAYEALVERLLASPAYGQRWARHWLDVVRFGESQGFERDKLRTNAWQYRDWVVDALNRDLPYDEFVRLQIAGDVFRPGDAEALIATGFLVAGPYDEVGQQQQSAAMRAVVRQDELEDLVSVVGQTFLGLTVNCSRCHDHKFDPIRQSEYYRLTAALGGVRQGEPKLPREAVEAQQRAHEKAFQARRAELGRELPSIEAPVREQILAQRRASPKPEPPKPFAAWDFNDDARDSVGELHLELHDGAWFSGGQLVLDGRGYATSPLLKKNLKAKTLEAWIALADLDQRGGGAMTVQTPDGKLFDAIVFGEREPRQWMAGSNNFSRTQSFRALPEQNAAPKFVHVAIVYAEDGRVTGYHDGQPYGRYYSAGVTPRFTVDNAQVSFGVRHFPVERNKLLRGAIDRARLYDRALGAAEVAASAGVEYTEISETELRENIPEEQRSRWASLRFEYNQLGQQLTRLQDSTVYAVAPREPEPAFVLHRGNPGDPREPVIAGGIASLRGVDADFGLDEQSSDMDRRRQLAEWITDARNPLFARVMVNRLWHYHFGVGLVDTPNDFGFNGGRPSHPELLEWLAGELVRSKFSLKHLQRLIVTSAAYRQSSALSAAAAKVDAGNRLLWRKSPQRLDAETLRDTLLAISGQLDTSLGGPGFYEFTTFVRNSQFYTMQDAIGRSFQRRTIYRTWVRSARSQLLDVFDCPDPSTKTPQRAVTTTPLQALSLLNNAFVLRAADDCAASIRDTAGDDVPKQVEQLFRRAYHRSPADEESRVCQELVRTHGLAALCRVVFNSNELLYVD
ncbi:MAG: DUF1553 domain-containing protein [Planctomycetes bacterium]|nr:DUF1553 domain-containing protein [Planctomycetota bacterium]